MSSLDRAREKAAEMRKRGELVVSHNPAQKVANLKDSGGRVSAHQAIKAMCWHCMGGTATEWDSDIKNTIRECTAKPESRCPCPLYDFRPYR